MSSFIKILFKFVLLCVTKDLKNRLLLHNTGKGAKFTRGSLWKLVFKKRFKLKNKAIKFESLLKKKRSYKIKLLNEQ